FGDGDWTRFCRAAGHPSWTGDARFATAQARMLNRGALDTCVESWTRSRSAEEVMATMQAAGVAAGGVADAADLGRRDPRVAGRGYWERVPTPEGDAVEFDGVPFKMSHTPTGVRAGGPLLGEHTDAILQRVAGLSPAAIAELRAANVVM